jgi:hypothetical protein
MSFGVLGDVLQDDILDQEQVHLVVFISPYPWTRQTSIGKTILRKTMTTSSLGEEHPPMYLAKYFFPFCFTKFAILWLLKKMHN